MHRRAFLQTVSASIFLPLIQGGGGFDLQVALNQGGLIDLPPGEYTVTTPLTMPSNTTLRGAGPGLTTLTFAHSGIGIKVGTGDDVSMGNVAIEGMTLRGAANDDSAPLELVEMAYTVDQVRASNVEFAFARQSGLRFTANTFGHGVLIDNCHFHDIATPQMAPLAGGALQGAPHEATVRNCRFINTGNNDLHHALYASGDAENLTVEGCLFQGAHARLHLFGGARKRVQVHRNRFLGQSRNYFNNCPDALVEGNHFVDTQVQVGASGVQFEGNSFLWEAAQLLEGVIILSSAPNTAFLGNRFERRNTANLAFISNKADGLRAQGNVGINAYNFAHLIQGTGAVLAGNISSQTDNFARVFTGAHVVANNVCTKLQPLDFLSIYGGSVTQQGNMVM